MSFPGISAVSANVFAPAAKRPGAAVAKPEFQLDAAQKRAAARLEHLARELGQAARAPWQRLFGQRAAPQGVYLWGGVGRGKTWLMDRFYADVALVRKRRAHFHAFMQEVHAALGGLKGRADPLAGVAQGIAAECALLCLDEFHVSDIADAMLLGRLLEELVARGTVLVITSNDSPDKLYRHGLQRERFLPAIRLIEARLDVVEVEAGRDYRLEALEKIEIYHTPPGPAAERNLAHAFEEIAGEALPGTSIEVGGRKIPVKRAAPGVAWLEFAEICGGPRSQLDYLEIARTHHTVLVSGVPRLAEEDAAAARRLIWLVDVLYDHRVKLIVSAAARPQELYLHGLNRGEFERTASRLTEMQTRRYLAFAHRG